jgi:hypothetical protein
MVPHSEYVIRDSSGFSNSMIEPYVVREAMEIRKKNDERIKTELKETKKGGKNTRHVNGY